MQMLTVLKKSILIVLAMLQFFAPLVHAHTGNTHFDLGIHVPGLESYLDHQDTGSLKNANFVWPAEGLLVSMSTGIKNPLDMTVKPVGEAAYAIINLCYDGQQLIAHEQNFSPQDRRFIAHQPYFLPHSPRAPPLNPLL